MFEIKAEALYEDFKMDKEMFHFSSYLVKSKYYDDSNKLVAGKMTCEIGDVAIKEFVGLKLKMYSFLADNNSDIKKRMNVNNNVFDRIGYSECKDF